MHNCRDEVCTVISGTGKAVINGVERELKAGDVFSVPAGAKHTVIATTDLHIIEVQIGSEISAGDKVKYRIG